MTYVETRPDGLQRGSSGTGEAGDVVKWPDEVDEVLAGDVTAGLAYLTPAGGAVAVGVAPVGLRDRGRGMVTITSSLGLMHKLERMMRDSRVALAFHAREHGYSSSRRYVLIQGDADVSLEPDERWLEEVAAPAGERFMGPVKTGMLWDRWLHEYYHQRVAVSVFVRRVVSWPDLRCEGAPEILGAPLPTAAPPQPVPNEIVARVDVQRAARRARERRHCLIAFRGDDGYPVELPVLIGAAHASWFELNGPRGVLPAGTRRAGLLAQDYGQELVPIAARQLSGWLSVADSEQARYTPYSDQGFKTPANKTVVLIANGWLAKRGFREAVKSGRLERLRQQQRSLADRRDLGTRGPHGRLEESWRYKE